MSRRADYTVEGAVVVHSVDELLEALKGRGGDDIFVIGGESIYSQLLKYCDVAYITKFKKTFDADAYLEDLDASEEWECVSVGESFFSNGETDTHDGMEFCFCEYRRK
jgi:dihydrofolate reductase